MATFSLVDATSFAAGYDFTTDVNKLSVEGKADELDSTTFGGDGWRTRKGGLKTVSATLEGFWQSATLNAVDPQSFTNLGTADRVFTSSPTGDDGDTAYLYQAGQFTYGFGAQVGELLPFNLQISGTNGVGMARGQLLLPKQTVTGNTSGTGRQMGDIAAGEYLYTTIHCFTAGTTATVIVESDDNSDFSSATTRSSTAVSAVGGTWVTRVAGAISDDWWRVRVASVTGTFSLAAAVAIQ